MPSERILPLSKSLDLTNSIGRSVAVRELTVLDFKSWLGGSARNREPIIANLCDGLDAQDLACFSDVALEEVDQMTAAEVCELAAVVREVNEPYFRMLDRLAPGGEQ